MLSIDKRCFLLYNLRSSLNKTQNRRCVLYIPTDPYVFKSGKREGKCLELLMFEDYQFLHWLYNTNIKGKGVSKNQLELHLEWLLMRGENRQTAMKCPQCNANHYVSFFSVRYSYNDFSIGPQFTSCSNKSCVESLKALSLEKTPAILPIKFSSILTFKLKIDRKRVTNLFRHCFGLPRPLKKDVAFRFFTK